MMKLRIVLSEVGGWFTVFTPYSKILAALPQSLFQSEILITLVTVWRCLGEIHRGFANFSIKRPFSGQSPYSSWTG